MAEIDIANLIKSMPIFQDFSPNQRDNILDIIQTKSFSQGQVVFNAGDTSEDILVVLEGTLQIRANTGSEIATVQKFGIVGEMGVLTDHPRSAAVTAQSNATVLSIPAKELQALIKEDPDMGLKVYRKVTHILSDRLRDNNILIEQQLFILEDLTGDSFAP